MKNIQVISGADNCKYEIYAATEDEFRSIFPNGQDIEFYEDILERIGESNSDRILSSIWRRPILKENVSGVHGTLFFDLGWKKRKYYPRKRFSDDSNG